MTDLLYQSDSYLKSFEAVVTGIDADNQAVILDRTAFYPGGGGQPADSGVLRIDGRVYPVKRARKGGAQVLHILEGEGRCRPRARRSVARSTGNGATS